MSIIYLTQDYFATVDSEFVDHLAPYNWRVDIRSHKSGPYIRAKRIGPRPGREAIYMHRSIWELANGPIPEGMTVDHIEHGLYGALDNRLSNLRLATGKEQIWNRRKTKGTTSQYIGVHWSNSEQAWVSKVGRHNKRTHLGVFDSEEAAAMAYDLAVTQLGDPDRNSLNFPENLGMYIELMRVA